MVSGTTSPARLSVANTSTDTVSPEVAEIERETNSRANPTAQQSQIAYSYGYGFRIGSDEIVNLQKAHIAMCDKMGNECRVLRTSQARADSYDAYGELRMQIAASKAGSLTEQLSAPAKEMGGALISSVRDGEDLSEQIIDSEARLNSRLALRDKLTGILQGNRGSVQELIEAEAAIAEVNEELDATRSRLEQFRNRIRYSDVRIEYEPAFGDTQVGFVRPVMTALRSIGSTLGVSIAGIIYTITALMPVALLLLALRWVLHRFGYRLRFWKNDLRRGSEAEA
ncbi:MAG: DUF4349 domain-containing protein [Pseudomonadota bacterium]